jgi:hypothetical protein
LWSILIQTLSKLMSTSHIVRVACK